MSAVPGPVWVAVAHEPENDGGDMQKWKAMQARLAPIMRAAAPNLGYSIILMGYHQLHGDAKYSLANTWPNTKIDVAGFDVYERYGWKGFTTWTDYKGAYFSKFQSWAQSKGVAWGLAETGYNDVAARASSTWSTVSVATAAGGGIVRSDAYPTPGRRCRARPASQAATTGSSASEQDRRQAASRAVLSRRPEVAATASEAAATSANSMRTVWRAAPTAARRAALRRCRAVRR